MSIATVRFAITCVVSFILTFLILTKILHIESPFSLQDIEDLYERNLDIEQQVNTTEEHFEISEDEAFFQKLAPIYDVPNVDCERLLDGDEKVLSETIHLAKTADWNRGFRLTEDDVIKEGKDCDAFVQSRGFITR